MILNAAYWVVAALPPQWHWDLSCYKVKKEEYGGEEHDSFTRALWKAIAITQSVEWVKIGQVAPVSEAWKLWVDTAGDVVERDRERLEAEGLGEDGSDEEKEWKLPQWDPDQALTDFLNPDAA